MNDFSSILSALVPVAKAAAVALGGPRGQAAVEIAEGVVKLIDRTVEIAGKTQPELQAERDELEKAVLARVDRTVDRLQG